MALPMRQSAINYAAAKLSSTKLDVSIHPWNNLQELAIALINSASPTNLGVLCQLHEIMVNRANAPSLKATWLAVKKLVETGLEHHGSSVACVSVIEAENFPELDKYKSAGLSYSYMLKCVNLTTLVAFAATFSRSVPTVMALMSQCEHNTWVKFGEDWGFDEDEYIKQAEPLLLAKLEQERGCSTTIKEGCALYPQGPYPNGYSATWVPAPNPAPAAATPTPTVSTTNQGASVMPTNTNTLASLNAAYKPIIDGMFAQSGLSITVDQVIAEISAKDNAEREAGALKLISIKQIDTIESLERKLASASRASALPSTISITSANTTIPSGTMNMVQADSIFPIMSGINLMIPSFTWDHAHPDVPALTPDYIFRKELLLKTLRCLAKGENFWSSGHTGSGKTSMVEQVAARLGWPVARVAFDSAVDRSELVGRMQITGDGNGGTNSTWLPGILEKAITNGYILLCDEMDAGHPNSLYTLQPLLEGKPLTLLEDGGRVVQASLMARFGATGNTTGNGDPSGLYPACRILSAATLDRFATFIQVPYMTFDEEVALISNAAPSLSKKLIKSLAKFAGEMRNAFTSNQTPISYSPRRSIAFAREVEDLFAMGFKDEQEVISIAFKSKLYDAASEEFRQRITEIANSTLGGVDPTKPMA